MGSINVKARLMPSSPETDLDKIKEEIRKILGGKYEVKGISFEEELIAFGLKAIILVFIWPEDKELDSVEEELRKIENVNSLEILDIRISL